MKNILVIGATGPQARPVAQKLAKAGFNVRALVRDTAKAQDLGEAGVEVVKGDLDNSEDVAAATAGQDGVFLLISFFSGRVGHAHTVIEAAKAAGVKKIVWNATGTILPVDIGNPAIDMRRTIYAELQQSGIPFVALQPTIYMENFFIPAVAEEVRSKDTLAYPMPEAVKVQWISHVDAASFAVAAFNDPSTESYALEISGPEKLSGSQIAESFSRGLGRKISFRPMPPKEFAAAIANGGNEEVVTSYYQSVYDNPDVMSTNVDYDAALKRLPIEPTSLEAFAQLNRSTFSN